MEVSVFSHSTALRAFRSTRTWRSEIPWHACSLAEQRRAMAAATGRLAGASRDTLGRLGIIAQPGDDTGPDIVHMLVGHPNRRVCHRDRVAHLQTHDLPAGSLLKVAPGIYVCTPELCFIQMARTLHLPELAQLGCELMGLYAIRPDGPGGFTAAEPAMTRASLERYLRRATGMVGSRPTGRVLPHLLARSRSPMETALALMFSLPQIYGGFGSGTPELNHVIRLNERARQACGRSSIECDVFFPRARVDMEYNSVYHNSEAQRRRDDERAAALACMGILVVPVSISQFKDMEKLEAIARLIAKRSGGAWRARSKKHALRQAVLHGFLSQGL